MIWRIAGHPLMLASLALAFAGALLCLPLRLPIGGSYWDLHFVVDGGWRVIRGQVPHVDFFAPSGALPFVVAALAMNGLPQAHPLLAVQYGPLLLLLPLLALVGLDAARRGSWVAAALIIPFAVFALAPVNTFAVNPAPGVDGFGLYNRISSHMLYVLVAALMFMRDGLWRGFVLAVVLAMLFFTKINAFAPALLMLSVSVLAGQVSVRGGSAALCGAGLIVLAAGLPGGLLAAYLADIVALLAHNGGRIVERLVSAVSVKFDVLLPVLLLALLLIWLERRALATAVGRLVWPDVEGRWTAFRSIVADPGLLVAVFGCLALLVEAQNTGGHEYIFLWPLALSALLRLQPTLPNQHRLAVLLLGVAIVLPGLVSVVQRSARVAAAVLTYPPVAAPSLRALDSGSVRGDYLLNAEAIGTFYRDARAPLRDLAQAGQMIVPNLISEPAFQAFYLIDFDALVKALRQREATHGSPFRGVAVLDAVDPLSYALGRTPLRGVTVSVDLLRGFPASRRDGLVTAWAGAEALLIPRCPITPFRLEIEVLASRALAGRRIEALTPCWDIAVRL